MPHKHRSHTQEEGEKTHHKRVKRVKCQPPTPTELTQVVNVIREAMGVTPFKTERVLEQVAQLHLNGLEDVSQLFDQKYVLLSFLSIREEWDGKSGLPEIVNRWMDDPSKRPVLLAPGDKGYLGIMQKEGEEKQYLVFVVMSMFK